MNWAPELSRLIGPTGRKVVAIGLLLAGLLVISTLIILPAYRIYVELGNEIEDARFEIQRLDALLLNEDELYARLERMPSSNEQMHLLIRSASSASAFAELQDRIDVVLNRYGAKRSQITERSPNSDSTSLVEASAYVRWECTAENLARILYDLEWGQPMLFFSELNVRPLLNAARKSVAEDNPVLSVEALLSGYRLSPDRGSS